MQSFSNVIISFCALAVMLLFSGCDNESEVVEPSKKMLIMGTSADFPPFEFIKDKQIKGFDIDLAEVIAKKLGYSLYIRDVSFSGLIPAVKTGRVDFAAAGFTMTPERAEVVDFSAVYYTPSFAMIYRKDDPIPDLDHISGKSIGVQLGSTLECFLQSFKKDRDFKIISLTRNLPMIQDLKLGRLDGVLLEEAQAKVFSSKNEDFNYFIFNDNE
ncbi:MAG: transporter substrate-binding domain-containing protein, partial [Alphaproteobacteria bacterium]|nr:transporter substrate-binding domain-containing protein [Alphaproteobacteria bacterium]